MWPARRPVRDPTGKYEMVIEQMDDPVPHQQSPADDDGSGRAALAGSTASAGPAGVTGSAGLAGGLARGLAGLVSVDVPGLTTVCLVRHGETDWNVAGRLQGREDTLLNARGREQVAATEDRPHGPRAHP